MVPSHTNFNITKVFSLLSQTQNIDLKILAISKWFPSTQTLTIRKLSLSSHKQNIYFKEYWQPKNGSPPDKLQQCQSFLYQVIDKISISKILAISKWFPSTQTLTKVFSLLSQTQNIYFKKYWQPPNGSHIQTNSNIAKVFFIKS